VTGEELEVCTRLVERIHELERAAETTRAEHAAALGLATARIRELEGEREELLGLLRRAPKYVREDRAVTPGATRLARLSVEIEAIVARIEKAAKRTT
jgi:hypothetical protein